MRGWIPLLLTAPALALGACGGGDERQDADEPEGNYRLEVVDARFPAEQSIAERSTLAIQLRNSDTKPVPNVAVTIETAAGQSGGAPGAFAQNVNDTSLSDPSRPVWILDRGPVGGETAYTNTWALGELRAGELKTFEWRVTAVKAGDYTVEYKIAPGLDGKAKVTGGGGTGSFRVSIDDTPPDARVANDGKTVVREAPEDEESG